MFSRLRSRLSRILSPDKEEGTRHEKINDDETKETQSNRNDETKENTHQSPRERNRSIDSLERRRCLLSLMRNNRRNGDLPAYSSTQTSRPSSGLRGQQNSFIKGNGIGNDWPPPYNLPENMSSASRCQYIRGLIERRKAEIRTLEQQLEEETRQAGPSFTDTTLRVGESSSMDRTFQREETREENKEGTLSTDLPSQTKGRMQDIEYYIQRINKKPGNDC